MNWKNRIYESLTESRASKKTKAAKERAEKAKKKARMKAAEKARKARQITIDSGDPEVAHILDPRKPRRW